MGYSFAVKQMLFERHVALGRVPPELCRIVGRKRDRAVKAYWHWLRANYPDFAEATKPAPPSNVVSTYKPIDRLLYVNRDPDPIADRVAEAKLARYNHPNKLHPNRFIYVNPRPDSPALLQRIEDEKRGRL